MESFLDTVATRITARFGDCLAECTIVLPGKRAYQILRENISTKITKATWEPEFTTLTNLMADLTGVGKPNDIVLLAKLFNICKERLGTLIKDDFDAFESWGTILLEDFSGIDCNMVDAKKIFEDVSDYAKIDLRFKDTEGEDEAAKLLERHAQPQKAQYIEQFSNLWNHLFDIYTRFSQQLLKEGLGYTGLISRKAAEEAEEGKFQSNRKYIFVGFNTFNEAERRFIEALNPAAVYWDEYSFFDSKDVNRNLNPDGCGIRKIGCDVEEFVKADSSHKRRIEIIECPSDFIQCKVVEKKLKDVVGKSAIVLADDALLPVMLHSIPEDINVNVTTGQPIKNSPAYIFCSCLEKILLTWEQGKLPRELVEFILSHPVLQRKWENNAQIDEFKKNLMEDKSPVVDVSAVGDGYFKKIFCDPRDKDFSVSRYLMERLEEFAEMAEDSLVTVVVSEMRQIIESLSIIVASNNIQLSDRLFIKIIEKSFSLSYTPYKMDDMSIMSDIQITGILETRCQDFENVFILSADDDRLPKKSHLQSFIPMNLRRSFGLPMSGDFQRMSASYFYHIIMRAGNVYLLYNGNSSDARSGEPSRFIQQISYLCPKNTTIVHTPVALALKATEAPTLDFPHSEYSSKELSKKTFSPSMINSYLRCKRQFAFRYLYHIKERSIPTDGFLQSDYGIATHKVLEKLCKGNYCKDVARNLLDNFDSIVVPILNIGYESLRGKYPHLANTDEMTRLEEMVATWVRRVLEYDATHSEFETIGTEQKLNPKLEVDGKEIQFEMFADRMDKVGSQLRIVDYKTGRKDKLTLRSASDNVDSNIGKVFTGDRQMYEPVLQTLLYGLAYPGKEIIPAIYSTPLLGKDDFSPYLDKEETCIEDDYLKKFKERLTETIREILDPDSSLKFEGKESTTTCPYCAYKLICNQ